MCGKNATVGQTETLTKTITRHFSVVLGYGIGSGLPLELGTAIQKGFG